MEDYLNKGKEILKILISNGYEAYFIGDAVRSIILNMSYEDIEINTSATPDAIKGIFEFTKVEEADSGLIKLAYYGYDFYLSTFRIEDHKDKKGPMQIHYSKKLLDDLACRDFTIRAIAMSHSGKLTDAYDGYESIRKKMIKTIGKPKTRFADDPLRMLRAFRLVSELNFKMQANVSSAIRSKAKLFANVEMKRMISELRKMVQGKYYKKALDLLVYSRLYKYMTPFDRVLKHQNRRFQTLTWEEFLLAACVTQETIPDNILDLAENKDRFQKAFHLTMGNPKSNYSSLDLFANGEEICILANKINAFLKKTKRKTKKIIKAYKELLIHHVDDLAFKGEDILQLTKGESGPFLIQILDQVIALVLAKELENDYDIIKVFVINQLREKQINTVEDQINYDYPVQDVVEKNKPTAMNVELETVEKNLEYQTLVDAKNEEEMKQSLHRQGQVLKDYTEHRLDMLERRLNEQDQLLKEKDRRLAEMERINKEQQIKNDIEKMVDRNLEMLKEVNYLGNPQKDKMELSKKLHQVYLDYIFGLDDKYGLGGKNEKD